MRRVLALLSLILCAVQTFALTVTSPNGGEVFQRGSSKTITWNSTIGGNVKIELLRDGTAASTITGSTTNSGTYTWTFGSTQQPGGNYRVRITSTTNAAETDTSDADFCVATGSFEPSLLLNAAAQTSPPAITLNWPAWPATTINGYTVYRRAPGETTWGIARATLPASATFYTDSSVTVGTMYEYRVTRNPASGVTANGYIYAGIEVPLVENRGKVVLIVDNTVATALAIELSRLMRDLVGDGWEVLRHDVARTATVPAIKALIKADFDADPANVKAVLLFGHVPVPYSGNIAPDGHTDHVGAWPADNFYGDMDGLWTDATINSTAASRSQNDNVPDDGKFDQSSIPSDVELAVGRIDLASMDAFALNEVELLRQYLSKDHRYRFKLLTAQGRTLVDDEFDFSAEMGWRGGAALTGNANVFARDWNSTLQNNDYLFAFGGGGGTYTSASNVTSTIEVAARDPKAIFTALFGSYFADWDNTNNLLRAPLATTMGLTSVWGGRPSWLLHPMSMGEPIGTAYRLSQNNGSSTNYSAGFPQRSVHMALMGDPTLRLHAIEPPSNVVFNGQTLSWSASRAVAILGYHVYRSSVANGQFTRLTAAPLAATSFEDPSGGSTFTYMVRAVKLETSPTGSYFNASQGAFFNPASVASAVLVTPQVKTVLTGTTQQFVAELVDQFGYPITPQPTSFTWNSTGTGSVNASGLFTGGATTGYATVTAISGGFSGSASISVYPQPGTGTGLTSERWDGPPGSTVNDLKNWPAFPNFPDSQSAVTTLFESGTNSADNFGRRMRGVFTAPVSGDYRFLIASDDSSELRFSMDPNPNNATLIASVSGSTSSRQWTKYASQRSAVIALTAGQQCYIEALQKEATGNDNLAVGIDLPGGVPDRPIPASRLSPYTGWLPSPWSHSDIGTTTGSLNSLGFAELQPSTGTFALRNSGGANIGGSADAFRFVRQSISGDVVITARVTGVANTNADAKAGVMIRQSLNANSANAAMLITVTNGAAFQSRSVVGGSTTNSNAAGIAAPYWVRLERVGNRIRGFTSSDGINGWTQSGSELTLALADPVFVGLAATSRSTSSVGMAALNNVSVVSLTPIQSWRARQGLPFDGSGVGADDADPDSDGFPNLLEYALGLTPQVPNAPNLTTSSIANGHLMFSFRRDTTVTDITYTVEVASELAPNTWTPIARSIGGAATVNLGGAFSVSETGGSMRTVTVEDAAAIASTETRYIRLRVSR